MFSNLPGTSEAILEKYSRFKNKPRNMMSWTGSPTKCDCSGRQPVEWRKVAHRSTVAAYEGESALLSLKADPYRVQSSV